MNGTEIRVEIAPEIFRRYPGYEALVLTADGLENGPGDARSEALLQRAEEHARRTAREAPDQVHPHVAAWRAAYRSFGVNPKRHFCSIEALLRRATAKSLPRVNRLVDTYNAISVLETVPIGGEDWDGAGGTLRLGFATGSEVFETRESGEVCAQSPEPGEVIWVAPVGVTCRRWNWRQSFRTELTERVQRAVFVLDALPPYPVEALRRAGGALGSALLEASPRCRVDATILRAEGTAPSAFAGWGGS